MKRILSAILSFFLVLCVGIGFIGCKKNNNHKDTNSEYFGILRKIDVSGDLYVYIPKTGDCIFPTYENQENKIVIKGGRVYDEPLKEGDLIGLRFSTKDVQFQETYPVRITTPVKSIWLYRENVKLEQDGEDYLLTMPHNEFENMASYYEPQEVGATVDIVVAQFLIGARTGSAPYGSATVERIDAEQVTLRLHLSGGWNIKTFLEHFAIGALAFRTNKPQESI